ncbi:hypothetical protein BLS_002366 [Venturia inaequalis]|uniref:Chitin-binding type-1 domain-containing protein n=1 Tax=Venturia inaequalis TaxID=5025 RepID=A0A8H3UT55_VENIN|nr:hypothetical protein BLS_002366 [Venturia inaequalis]
MKLTLVLELLALVVGVSSSAALQDASEIIKTVGGATRPTAITKVLYASPDGSCGPGTNFTCKQSLYGGCCGPDNKCGSMADVCGSKCQSDFGYCHLGTATTKQTTHSTHVVTRLPPVRRGEEATSTHFATIGGPNHLTFVPHPNSTTTLSGSQFMTIETINASSYLTLGPVMSTTTLFPVNSTLVHHTISRRSITETNPQRQAEQTHPAGMPNPLDPICSGVCRPYFQECVKPPNVGRSAKCMNVCDIYYKSCLTSSKCNACPGKWSNGPDYASRCSEKCIVETCNKKFLGQDQYMCNVECGYESLECGGPIVSLSKPRIVNPDSATKIKRDYGTRVSSVIQTDTTHSGLPRDTVTGPAATIPATHSGSPRDTLTGPIPTFLATFITTTVLGHPRDTVTGPEATALTTAIGSLGTIPGHPRDTMTGSVPKDEAAWTNRT